jgi:hypothetical protein
MPRRVKSVWLLATVLAALPACPAGAEVSVAGDAKAVLIEARDASVEDVMAALGANFGLQYRGTATLERRITGSYRGSLQHVIRRLLDGYDFIVKTNVDDVEVTVLSGGNAGEARASMAPSPTSAIAPPPPPPSTKAQTARERRQRRQTH